jgi:hypothetical protein
MIVWGGIDGPSGNHLDSGASYDPLADVWAATSKTGAPSGRERHTAVWTGSKMIVWGGLGSGKLPWLNDGAVYDPATGVWIALSRVGAPSPRERHTALWTGSKMIVWGGSGTMGVVSTGAAYDPATDTWEPVSPSGAPGPRAGHTAVWTGSRMIVWGGEGDAGGTPGTGAIYDPGGDSWTPTTTAGAPVSRTGHTAIWTGSRMIVWGGTEPGRPFSYSTGGVFDPATQTWTATPALDAPAQRTGHTAVWMGLQMIVWGGLKTETSHFYSSGGAYDPALPRSPTDFHTLTPCRLVDTRERAGPIGGPSLAGGEIRSFPVTGLCGIPSMATAVAVNLTVVGANAAGHLRLYPAGTLVPDTSSINFGVGVTRANNAVISLGYEGKIAVYCKMASPLGQTHFVLDVFGYFE